MSQMSLPVDKMDYEGEPTKKRMAILCCQCGIAIEPNPANICVSCLRSQVDITDGIAKDAIMYHCKFCDRFLQPPSAWLKAKPESRELLSICLKKIKGLNKVRVVDASFLWTEPHSKRLKVKLTVQKEVLNNAVLEQIFVVLLSVHSQVCDDCRKIQNKDFWSALVQVRQKTSHKKTLFYLEQLILKHKAHTNCSNIRQQHEGIDFYFSLKQDARKLVDFLLGVLPCRYQQSQRLISHDTHNNTYNYKNTFSVEVVPICKDDIVCLPTAVAQQLGSIGQLCVVVRVAQLITLIDPETAQVAELSGAVYFRHPFQALVNIRNLTEFVVLETEVREEATSRQTSHSLSKRCRIADIWLAKSSELGSVDKQYFCRSHLGRILSTGDSVLGLDLTTSNFNDANLEKISSEKLPDVLIVKKIYDKAERRNRRRWKLKHLERPSATVSQTSSTERDYADFLDDLEEDPDYRKAVDIYIDKSQRPVEASATNDSDMPQISLQEMLDDIHLEESPDGDNEMTTRKDLDCS